MWPPTDHDRSIGDRPAELRRIAAERLLALTER